MARRALPTNRLPADRGYPAVSRGAVWRWGATAVAGVAALLSSVVAGFATSDGATLVGTVQAGVSELTGRLTPSGVELGVVGVLVLWFHRQFRLRWLSRRSTAVLVADLQDADHDAGEAGGQRSRGLETDATLSARLRAELASARLSAVASMPADEGSQAIIDVLDQGEQSRWVAALMRVPQWAWPTHVFEVHGTYHEHGADRVLSVELVAPALRRSWTPFRVVAPTWSEAVRQAANGILGQCVALNQSDRGTPLQLHNQHPVPPDVIDRHRLLESYQAERRFDEALELATLLIKEDPTNPRLRLQLGQLQEQLGLRLHALATYTTVEWPMEPRVRWSSAGQPSRNPAALLARFRLMLQLGVADELADQWLRDFAPDADPDGDRARLRSHLEESLVALYGRQESCADARRVFDEVGAHLAKCAEPATAVWAPWQMMTSDQARDRLRRLFSACADVQLRRLDRPAHFRRGWTPAQRRRVMTPTALRVCETWLDARQGRHPRHRWKGSGSWRWEWLEEVLERWSSWWNHADRALAFRLDPGGTCSGECTHVGDLAAAVEKRLTSGPLVPWRRRTRWIEQYNAACTYAVALARARDRADAIAGGPPSPAALARLRAEEDRHAALAALTLNRISEAIHDSEPEYFEAYRTWVRRGDPDLSALRSMPPYQIFEAHYFAAVDDAPPQPRRAREFEGCLHAVELLAGAAEVMAARWTARATSGREPLGPGAPAWADERLVWAAVVAVLRDRRRWEARVWLRNELRRTAPASEPPLVVAFPSYISYERDRRRLRAIDGGNADTALGDLYAAKVAALEQRLQLLLTGLRPHDRSEHSLRAYLEQQAAPADGAATHPASRPPRDAARRQVEAWTRVAEYLRLDARGDVIAGRGDRLQAWITHSYGPPEHAEPVA